MRDDALSTYKSQDSELEGAVLTTGDPSLHAVLGAALNSIQSAECIVVF